MHGVHGVIDSPLLGIKLEGFSLSLSLSLSLSHVRFLSTLRDDRIRSMYRLAYNEFHVK